MLLGDRSEASSADPFVGPRVEAPAAAATRVIERVLPTWVT
jgi:hypothetical protein